jgi:hypothetical protein
MKRMQEQEQAKVNAHGGNGVPNTWMQPVRPAADPTVQGNSYLNPNRPPAMQGNGLEDFPNVV